MTLGGKDDIIAPSGKELITADVPLIKVPIFFAFIPMNDVVLRIIAETTEDNRAGYLLVGIEHFGRKPIGIIHDWRRVRWSTRSIDQPNPKLPALKVFVHRHDRRAVQLDHQICPRHAIRDGAIRADPIGLPGFLDAAHEHVAIEKDRSPRIGVLNAVMPIPVV